MHRLLTACFASFGELANQSIFLSALGAEEWATDAPVTGLQWEMDWGSVGHLPSSTGPVAQSGPRRQAPRGWALWGSGREAAWEEPPRRSQSCRIQILCSTGEGAGPPVSAAPNRVRVSKSLPARALANAGILSVTEVSHGNVAVSKTGEKLPDKHGLV